MPKLKEEIATLKNQDTYTLMLFVLFKLRNIPEYSTLSELIYILNKNEFLKLCEYFGGMTIKLPTIDELESLVNSLVLYQLVNIDKKDFNESLKLLGCSKQELKQVKSDYYKIVEILDKYDIG